MTLRSALIGVALLLAAVVAAEWFLWPAEPPRDLLPSPSQQTIQLPELPASPDFRLPPLRIYREIAERPLFIKGRRPPAISRSRPQLPDDKQHSGFPDHIHVQAVVITPAARRALLHDAEEKATLYVGINTLVEGWQVTRIDQNGVTFARGRQEVFRNISGPANHNPWRASPLPHAGEGSGARVQ